MKETKAITPTTDDGKRYGPWKCGYPGCTKRGVGYRNKKWCGNTHRSWGYRQVQKQKGRVRTAYGYKDAEPARKSA